MGTNGVPECDDIKWKGGDQQSYVCDLGKLDDDSEIKVIGMHFITK